MGFKVAFLGLELFHLEVSRDPRVLLVNATGDYEPEYCHSGMDHFQHAPLLRFLEDDAAVEGTWDGISHQGGVCEVPLKGLTLRFETDASGGASTLNAIPRVAHFDECYPTLKSDLGPGHDKPAIATVEWPGAAGSLNQDLVGMGRGRNQHTHWVPHPNPHGAPPTPLAEAVYWEGDGSLKLVDQAQAGKSITFDIGADEVRLAITNLPTSTTGRPGPSKDRLLHFQLFYQLFEVDDACDDGQCGIPIYHVRDGNPRSHLKPLAIRGWLRGGPILTAGSPEELRDGGGALCPPSKFP